MTVSELMDKLREMPSDAEVYVDVGTEQCAALDNVRLFGEGLEGAWVGLALEPGWRELE